MPLLTHGVSGYSGFSGVQGVSGFSGYSGTTGSNGTSGFSGVSGYSGFSGKSGFSGISGYSGTTSPGFPTGSIIMWGGISGAPATPPTGWLNCDGSAVSRSTYAALFSIIFTNFGAGNGSTTFNLPDLRGRFPIGLGSQGGGAGTYALNQTGGEETHTLSVSELASHSHTISTSLVQSISSTTGTVDVNGDGSTGTYVASVSENDATGEATDNAGSDGAHNNMPPYLALDFIIKT